jgi:hypothetical protein
MNQQKQKIITPSGREFPKEWSLIYGEPLGYFQSIFLILKLAVYIPLWRTKVGLSGWIARATLPVVWLVMFALGQGSMLIFGVVGFISLIVSGFAFESEAGMEGRLIAVYGWAIPLVVAISPVLALFIMGGGNTEGLGKASKWNKWTSFNTVDQARCGRTTYRELLNHSQSYSDHHNSKNDY